VSAEAIMKLIRRLIILLALLIMAVCVVLVLNVTAPNPTGRRYSSAPVQTRGGGQAIGDSGEAILSADLRTPNNNAPDQLQCICNHPGVAPSRQCRVCLVSDASIQTYRIPDFVGASFLAESKNRATLPFTDTAEQITDYVTAAKKLGRPLWLYVRVDTNIAPEFFPLLESTGGGVVRYFAAPGYVDPVDAAAKKVLPVTGVVLAVMIVWEFGARQVKLSPPTPRVPVARAQHKTDAAEDFAARAKDRTQRRIDIEDSRGDGRQ
jgi:hypothetical protein